MLFDTLAGKLGETVRKLQGSDRINEKNVAAAMKDVKRALLDADVNLRVVNKLVKEVQQRAVGMEVLPGVTPGQQFVKIIYEELSRVMGADATPLASPTGSDPVVILLAGLQGAGKTTAAAKLALYCKAPPAPPVGADGAAQNAVVARAPAKKVLLVAADVYRPAAIEQLKTLGARIETEVFSLGTELSPEQIAKQGLEYARKNGFDTVIVDTAGRQVIDSNLMSELKRVKAAVSPSETLLVVDAMTGQEAANLTQAFNDQVGISGAILTKLDGDTRGGAALSVQQVSGKPIKFIGVGETVEKLEPFYPERMASRILGMGDVLSFVEKAQEAVEEKQAAEMTKKMLQAQFDFDDFLKQTAMMSKMGSFAGMMKMLPGMSGIDETQLASAEAKLKVSTSMIQSMTKAERRRPDLLISDRSARSRLSRIANGAGRSFTDANTLISDFQRMRTMMARMSRTMVGNAMNSGVDPSAAMSGLEGQSVLQPGMGGNRSARRKSAKKKEKPTAQKKGFGR